MSVHSPMMKLMMDSSTNVMAATGEAGLMLAGHGPSTPLPHDMWAK